MSTSTLRHPAITPDSTRADAIARGDLIDLSGEARRLRFRHAVACSREVWEDCILWTDEMEQAKGFFTGQETEGRLREVLYMALLASKRARGAVTHFEVCRVEPYTDARHATRATLMLTIGPGDRMEPVLTIRMA